MLQRNVLRFHPATQARLDELAELATSALHRKVSRAAVVRAAVCTWLASREGAEPALLFESIGASLVARGRKAR